MPLALETSVETVYKSHSLTNNALVRTSNGFPLLPNVS